MKKLLLACSALVLLAGCAKDADVVSKNLSLDADQFKIMRRIVFYNGITGEYMLVMTGLCSIGNDNTDREVSITCKTGPDQYKKNFLGLSDNVTYFAEQIEATTASPYFYEVVFKPLSVIPNIVVK